MEDKFNEDRGQETVQKRCGFADLDPGAFPFKTRNMRPYTLGR